MKNIIEKFHQAAWQSNSLFLARNRIFQDFRAHVKPSHSDQVLDVGVSDVVNDGAKAEVLQKE